MNNIFGVIINSFKSRGVFVTIKFLLSELMFDLKFNVDTAGYFNLDNLTINCDKEHGTKYQAANYSLLTRFFKKYSSSISGSTIVDFGSGKGRILLMSMKYNAKKCIGVEFAKELINISKKNISSYKIRNNLNTDVDFIFNSALNYKFTGDEDVMFFYNPFDETILEPIIEKILELNSNPIIVYIYPVYKDLFKNNFIEIDNFDNDIIVYRKQQK